MPFHAGSIGTFSKSDRPSVRVAPSGRIRPYPEGVKTFGLQECKVDGTGCTSEFGNYPHSPAGA